MKPDKQHNTITPEKIWKILNEASKNHKEAARDRKVTERILKETARLGKELKKEMKKTDEQMKKTDEQMKKTDEQMKKTDERFNKMSGRFDDRWGSLVESLVEGKVVELLRSRGIAVTNTFSRATGFYWTEENGTREQKHREIDIIAANGSEVVAVEVKTTLKKRHIKYFLNTLQDFRKYFRRYKTEAIYGAMAYLKSKKEITDFAEKEGLFIIRATGDSASLINKKSFKPKAF